MKEDLQQIMEWLWEQHRGGMVGAVLGSFLGICLLCFGVFQTAFVLICCGIGIWLGMRSDSSEGEWLTRIRRWKSSESRRLK